MLRIKDTDSSETEPLALRKPEPKIIITLRRYHLITTKSLLNNAVGKGTSWLLNNLNPIQM